MVARPPSAGSIATGASGRPAGSSAQTSRNLIRHGVVDLAGERAALPGERILELVPVAVRGSSAIGTNSDGSCEASGWGVSDWASGLGASDWASSDWASSDWESSAVVGVVGVVGVAELPEQLRFVSHPLVRAAIATRTIA